MTNKWQVKSVNQFCKIVSGSTPQTAKPSNWGGNISWITPMDLSKLKGKYIKQGERNITEEGLKSCSAELIPAKSLIMSSRAPIGYFAINSKPVATNQGCKSFVCDDSVDIEFLYYALNQAIDSIKRLGSGSTFAEVNKKNLENLLLLLPKKSTQQKIADILSSIDEALQKTDQLIHKSEKLKQGLMGELITNSKSWKKAKLGEVTKFIDYRGKTPKKVASGIPLITAKNVRMGYVEKEPQEFIRPDDYDSWMTRGIPNNGDVLFTTEAPLGNISQLETKDKVAFAQRVIIIQPLSGLLPSFLKYLLLSRELQEKIHSLSSGGTVKGIKAKVLKQINIPIPSIDEQNRISGILRSIDKKIALEKENKGRLLVLKRGLMHDIFSQKVQIK